jgi:hypothetical protein
MLRIAHVSIAVALLFPLAAAGPSVASTTTAITVPDDDGEDEAGPTDEEVEAAVAELEAVLEEGAFDEKVAALVKARAMQHEDMAKAVATAVKDDSKEVRIAAIDALGHIRVGAALKSLHGFARKKALVEEEDQAVAIFKAIGRHGDTDSIKVLEDDLSGSSRTVAEARILALGKIRHEKSVEALIAIMNKSGKGKKGNVGQYMDEIRLALHVLTGADEGTNRKNWQSWWNDNKHDIEVDPDGPAELDGKLGRTWRRFWDEEEKATDGAEKEREDGDDDEGGDGGAPPARS